MKKRKSEKVNIFSLTTFAFLLLLSFPAFGQKPIRITFAKGAVNKTVVGNLSGYKSTRNYVIRVRAGQTLSTEQVGDAHHITIFVQGLSGEDVGDSDASCNNRREITPTVAGDYKIQVIECLKADAWKGTFEFRVTVR